MIRLDFRRNRKGNYWARTFSGGFCTVFRARSGSRSWSYYLDDVPAGEWWADADTAMAAARWQHEELQERAERVHVPDAVAFFGLDRPFSEADLKQRYRKMALATHPDRGGDPQRFKEVQQNFEEAMKRI